MKYRNFGRLDWEASVLGFGIGRLPRSNDDHGRIDEVETTQMLRYAIDNGVNYINLGYIFDAGQREEVTRCIGRALGDGYRRKVKITASLPVFLIDSAADFERYLEECLERLQTDRLDFFLPAGLNRETWPDFKKRDILPRIEAAMADGRIGWLGFAFHDDLQTLRGVLEDYDKWSLAEFQYSFMDVDHHPGMGGLKYTADKGLAVVTTEPLKGGRLTEKLPGPVADLWAGKSPAEWGLRWVWNHPEVTTVVNDMSTLAQVKENIALAEKAGANSLTVPEELLVNRLRDAYRKLRPIPCTACRGCMPCPLGIDVPRIFEIYNDAIIYDDIATAQSIYRHEKHDIGACTACGACANACGLKIPILDWLEKARIVLAGDE